MNTRARLAGRLSALTAYLASILCLLLLLGCASVPKETVELSAAVGNDIRELHTGYRNTVRQYFDHLRQTGLAVVEETQVVAYVETLVQEGGLDKMAAEEDWKGLRERLRAALTDIDAIRSEFVEGLDKRETVLLNMIDDAFGRAISANANVTAYLRSLRNLGGLQDQVLQATGLGGARDEIVSALGEASEYVTKANGEKENVPESEK